MDNCLFYNKFKNELFFDYDKKNSNLCFKNDEK